MNTYETILLERPESAPRVALITLNRPAVLNALNSTLMFEMRDAVRELDADPGIGCIVVTGSEKAFAAGADIAEMAGLRFPDTMIDNMFAAWDEVAGARTPLLAAVSGYALGGGCELAMLCDVILAADTARFGQPEIKLGVIPGIGGSQRLTRAVGKAKAMELFLTGRTITAEEAERAGLVSRVVPAADLLTEALATATTIAGMSYPAVLATKEAVNRVFEGGLAEGIRFERRVFHSLFGTADQREGMDAFLQKRPAQFRQP